jgi:hypothetical protein
MAVYGVQPISCQPLRKVLRNVNGPHFLSLATLALFLQLSIAERFELPLTYSDIQCFRPQRRQGRDYVDAYVVPRKISPCRNQNLMRKKSLNISPEPKAQIHVPFDAH